MIYKLTPEIISCIAAINSKSHVTISGSMDFLQNQVIKNLPSNVRFIKLNVSHAFHSHFMQPARLAYMNVLAKINFNHRELLQSHLKRHSTPTFSRYIKKEST